MSTIKELDNFKNVLENQYNIHGWRPTYAQLQDMQEYVFSVSPTIDKQTIFFKIQEIYGKNITVMFLGGLDTSTTADLLIAARAAANNGNGAKNS